ncbi:MAG: C45 family peptidase [Isosphaeraceae bacterium]
MTRSFIRLLGFVLAILVTSLSAQAETKTLARCGAGFLEEIDGAKVLHVKGSPYEMGYQQGAFLKDDIRELVRFLFDVKAKELKIEVAGLKLNPDPKAIIAMIATLQKPFVPERYFEEMQGVADGAGMSLQEVVMANFIPELFHCSGFALSGSATKDGQLYHGRILDYGCDWRLQDHAVLTVAEPVGKIPFVNVTYAGFIGSVTGMNAKQISIGEMGGGGRGHWAGVPMALLVRMVLEDADDLEEAIAIFRDNPRTCEYYYVIADGETGQAVGMEASWNVFSTVSMGGAHPKLPHAVKDAVLLSAGTRYEELVRRVKAGHGQFDAESARNLMSRPVAMQSNLHSVLFETKTTRLWVANASKDGEPAASQPYHAFQLTDLLTHTADEHAPTLEWKARQVDADKTLTND